MYKCHYMYVCMYAYDYYYDDFLMIYLKLPSLFIN